MFKIFFTISLLFRLGLRLGVVAGLIELPPLRTAMVVGELAQAGATLATTLVQTERVPVGMHHLHVAVGSSIRTGVSTDTGRVSALICQHHLIF